MRLALDHHYATSLARRLRARQHDVVTAVERGWHTLGDEDLLAACANEQRVLLTNNVADFAVIDRIWREGARAHAGLLFTSDTRFPRRRDAVGALVQALDEVLTATPDLTAATRWL